MERKSVERKPLKSILKNHPLAGTLLGGALFASAFSSCSPVARDASMTVSELQAIAKIDAHAHIKIDAIDKRCEQDIVALLRQHNMKWLDICVEAGAWSLLQQHMAVATTCHADYPGQFAWATSFNLENWGWSDWRQQALQTMRQGFAGGAVGVKVWKEIGMVLQDTDGHFVMIDDERFDPLFDYIQSQNKTLVAHIGEPRNCWLPLEFMTAANDRNYYREHPQYHAYRHPEIPGYWDQIRARDHLLAKHPQLRVVGCHLGSLEFDVAELAKRLDQYPNFAADMAGRVHYFQHQDRDKVRNFIIKYQDRLLYGTDHNIIAGNGPAFAHALKAMDKDYLSDYRFFATAEELGSAAAQFRGLALPAAVLKKIYYENALKWYPGI